MSFVPITYEPEPCRHCHGAGGYPSLAEMAYEACDWCGATGIEEPNPDYEPLDYSGLPYDRSEEFENLDYTGIWLVSWGPVSVSGCGPAYEAYMQAKTWPHKVREVPF